VARNAFALALLTAIALGGCSQIKGVLQGDKEEKAAEARLAALRARTDSLRKARRVADSLAQIRFVACSDSLRAVLTKPPASKAKKTRKRQPKLVVLSDEAILVQVQNVCATAGAVPQPTVATADSPAKTAAADSKVPEAVPAPAQPAAAPANPPVAAGTPAEALPAAATTAAAPSSAPQDTAAADSVKKGQEMDMVRETFAYSGASRDPFNSLLNMAKNGPELADLQLVGIYQNLRAHDASIAVFREKDGGKRHKLRAGDQVGRSRLVQIRERDVVFMIEDFGFERQETLSLRKQEDVTP
jgi:hypothetical protein